MVASESHGKLARLDVFADDLGYGLADTRHKTRVLELADGRIAGGVDALELVVAIEFDLPSQLSELIYEAGFDEMNGSLVHTGLALGECEEIRSHRSAGWRTCPPMKGHPTI